MQIEVRKNEQQSYKQQCQTRKKNYIVLYNRMKTSSTLSELLIILI